MTDNDHCSQCGVNLNEFEKTTSSLYKGHSLAGLCFGCKVKWIEDNHGDADAELFKLRDKARQRNFKFMQNKRASGSRQCSAILTQDAYYTLTGLRDTAAKAGKPQSFGDIIEAALNVYVSTIEPKKGVSTIGYRDDDTKDSKDDNINVCSDVDKPRQGIRSAGRQIAEKPLDLLEPEPDTPEPKSFDKDEICKIIVDLRNNHPRDGKPMSYENIAAELKKQGYSPKTEGKDTFHHSTIKKYYNDAK